MTGTPADTSRASTYSSPHHGHPQRPSVNLSTRCAASHRTRVLRVHILASTLDNEVQLVRQPTQQPLLALWCPAPPTSPLRRLSWVRPGFLPLPLHWSCYKQETVSAAAIDAVATLQEFAQNSLEALFHVSLVGKQAFLIIAVDPCVVQDAIEAERRLPPGPCYIHPLATSQLLTSSEGIRGHRTLLGAPLQSQGEIAIPKRNYVFFIWFLVVGVPHNSDYPAAALEALVVESLEREELDLEIPSISLRMFNQVSAMCKATSFINPAVRVDLHFSDSLKQRRPTSRGCHHAVNCGPSGTGTDGRGDGVVLAREKGSGDAEVYGSTVVKRKEWRSEKSEVVTESQPRFDLHSDDDAYGSPRHTFLAFVEAIHHDRHEFGGMQNQCQTPWFSNILATSYDALHPCAAAVSFLILIRILSDCLF
ncbi:hypothetical protein D9619_007713 [Psilocybe cf. subviscida]|uniref:Uncharacterized protein n=1 Tax=Psilocybe cf. subviscida TaxID=2480587 RepID=A0A8H5AU57_9AGAR|nr:hypothetical protein D9619_007713 [Psilocybe cf. subviscida]